MLCNQHRSTWFKTSVTFSVRHGFLKKMTWVLSKRCGNWKVGVPPASSTRLAKISVTPKPLNKSTWNFRQEWIISYIKCMQNFSLIGKRIHARKKSGSFFGHTLYVYDFTMSTHKISSHNMSITQTAQYAYYTKMSTADKNCVDW